MTGSRDLQTFNLYGQRKHVGAVDAPIFANNGCLFLVASIGADGQPGYGVTGTAGGSFSSTLASASTAGAGSISVTSDTGITANTTIIQIDVNNPSTPTTAECRLVTAKTGSGPYTLTLDSDLVYAHASGAAAISVVAPFLHTITPEVYLPSLTVEKNLGGPESLGGQSLQFAGCRIGKFDVKAQATDTEAQATFDLTAQSVAILDDPSSYTFVDESPFAFSTYVLEYNGSTYKNPTNFSLSVDNGVKPTYTMNGSQDLQFNPAVSLMSSGSVDLVYDQLNDMTYGFWDFAYTEIEAAMSLVMTNAQGDAVGFHMPVVDLSMDTIDPKATDVIMENVAFKVRRDLASQPYSIYATILNSTYVAYAPA